MLPACLALRAEVYGSGNVTTFLLLGEAKASRAVIAIVPGSDGRDETLFEPAKIAIKDKR